MRLPGDSSPPHFLNRMESYATAIAVLHTEITPDIIADFRRNLTVRKWCVYGACIVSIVRVRWREDGAKIRVLRVYNFIHTHCSFLMLSF